MFLCGPNGPIEATYVSGDGADCVVSVDGGNLIMECHLLHARPDECSADGLTFAVGQRVALRMPSDVGARVWPAQVRKNHANGRVAITLDGLSSVQTVDRVMLVKL